MRRTSRHLMPSVLALHLLVAIGCAGHQGNGRIYSDSAWEKSHGAAGKVLLIVSGSPTDRMASDHMAEVTELTCGVLQHLPNTTVVQAKPPATACAGLSTDPADAQAIARGRAQGADSVCVLSMAKYYGLFWIGLTPWPEWNGSTHILYSLRLIDVHTGNMLAHAITSYSTGGPFLIRTHSDLKHDLEQALQDDLTPPEHPVGSAG